MSHAFRRLRHTKHPARDLTTFRLFLPGSLLSGPGVWLEVRGSSGAWRDMMYKRRAAE
jgi:hypothetical protein